MANFLRRLFKPVGEFFNDITGQTAAREAEQAFNAEQAELNRQWQERMSNTAVQRQVEDMKTAGINPASAFSSGNVSGASTPGGATASAGSGNSSGTIPAIIYSLGRMAVGLGQAKMYSTAKKAASAATGIATKTINNKNVYTNIDKALKEFD